MTEPTQIQQLEARIAILELRNRLLVRGVAGVLAMLLAGVCLTAQTRPQAPQPNRVVSRTQAPPTMIFGSVVVSPGMMRTAIVPRLAEQFTLQDIGGGSGYFVSSLGPPFRPIGQIYFDAKTNLLTSAKKSWSPDDQQAGAATVEAVYAVLTQITAAMPPPSGLTSLRFCEVTISLDMNTTTAGGYKRILFSSGARSIDVSVAWLPDGAGVSSAVTIDEMIRR